MADLDMYKRMLDQASCGIGIYEVQDGVIRQHYMSDGYFRLLSITREDREKQTRRDPLAAVHPDDRLQLRAVGDEMARGQERAEIYYRTCNGYGAYVWLRVTTTAEVQADGRRLIYASFFDVDAQIRTQNALRNEQALLRLAMQNAQLNSWEFNSRTRQLFLPKSVQKQAGLPYRIDDVPESLIRSGFVHPDCVDTYREFYTTPCTPENPSIERDLHIRSADRTTFVWRRSILTYLFDASGRYLKTIGTSMDITRQKEQEALYHRQMLELNEVDAANLIGKGRFNLTRNRIESSTVRSSQAVTSSTDITYDEFIVLLQRSALLPEKREQLAEKLNRKALIRQKQSDMTHLSLQYLRKVGTQPAIWVETYCKLYSAPDTNDIIAFIYSYNVTEKVTLQEMVNAVVRLDYDYLALLDCRAGSYILYANPGSGRFPLPLSYASDYEAEVARYARNHLAPESLEQHIRNLSIANLRQQLAEKPVYACYDNVIRADGTISRKKLQFSYLDRSNEKILITRVDITDVYDREQQHLRELQEAAEAARAASVAKTEFLSRMSHDLRTPMNAIIGLTELASDERTDLATMFQYMRDIRAAGGFLLGLVNDCLDMDKISSRKMRLHAVPYTYEAFRSGISTIIEPLCRQKNINFIFPEADPKCTVMTDPVRFEQVFINLLTNAVKFTPVGGKVTFLASGRACDGTLACEFVVRDTGIGMSAAFQERMFEPFEQEYADDAPQSQGTGLGLPIVKSIVDLMHGTISVVSAPGAGTSFTVHLTLPAVQETPPQSAASAAIDVSQLSGRRILLVEDQPLNTEIAKMLLERQGMQTVCACDGADAVQLFTQAAPGYFDAILMDIRMPVMDGLEAAQAIRSSSHADASRILIIAMTANAFEEDVRQSLAAGMNEHLSKPINPALLYATLFHYICGSDE